MTLMEQIKTRQIAARKASDTKQASLLTTLLGEAAMVGKNAGRETTDAEVVAVVKKFIKNVNETIVALETRGQLSADYHVEREILEQFLPQQLNEDTLMKIAIGRSNMPDFMKYLKENFAGQYDGKMASTVAKSVFN